MSTVRVVESGKRLMALDYPSFEAARKSFTWSQRWKVFTHDREHLNIAYECVERHPKHHVAIRLRKDDGGYETYSFGELSRLTSQFANMLKRRGVNPGDRVGIILNPSLEYYVSFFGTLKRGAVAVPCYALLGPDGLEHRLRLSNARLAIINKDRRDNINNGLVSGVLTSEELLAAIASESEDYKIKTCSTDLAVIQFSSGTTGQPKQVPYAHGAMSVTAVFTKFWLGLKAGDRYMCTSSPAWGHGIWYGTVAPLIFGNGIGAYSGKFRADALLESLEEFEITVMSAVPRVYKEIMDCGRLDDYKLALRRLTYTGSAIQEEVLQYFKQKLNIHIGSTYGNTESGPIVLDYAFDDWKAKLGSTGKPMIGVELAILDEKGNELPKGQIGEVAVRRKGKWVSIGDYGYFDEEDYFYPKGRSDDVIKSSGYRIGPFEVESVIEKHGSVRKAAVIGSPDKERGEIIKAFVALKSGFEPTGELASEIQDFVKKRLSMHEYPKEIEFVQEIPETPDGKLKRKELKRREYEAKGMQLT